MQQHRRSSTCKVAQAAAMLQQLSSSSNSKQSNNAPAAGAKQQRGGPVERWSGTTGKGGPGRNGVMLTSNGWCSVGWFSGLRVVRLGLVWRGGWSSVEVVRRGSPHFFSFFRFPNVFSFSGVFTWNFWWCLKRRGPHKCTFGDLWAISWSPSGPVWWRFHTMGQRAQTCIFEVLAFKKHH